jgi:hypothetical protein
MRIARLAESTPGSLLQGGSLMQEEAPAPRPGLGELLIQVCAAGIILTELSWYPTSHKQNRRSSRGSRAGS